MQDVRRLQALLGAYIKTRKIKTPRKLIEVAAVLYGFPPTPSVSMMVKLVEELSVEQRRERARANLGKLNPDQMPRRPRVRSKAVISAPPNNAQALAFYETPEWRRLSYDVKKERGRRCECCGATPEHGVRIITDHVKPVRKYWHLRLERSNLQVLCDDCNLGKGSRDETDFREPAEPRAPTSEEIQAAMTESGGWTKAQLAEWGVPWPPPRGWKEVLLQLTPPDGFLN